jgi:hypothetical protein
LIWSIPVLQLIPHFQRKRCGLADVGYSSFLSHQFFSTNFLSDDPDRFVAGAVMTRDVSACDVI